jgi:hypothetical protein
MSPPLLITPAGLSPVGLAYGPGIADLRPAPAWLADPIDPVTGDLKSMVKADHPVDAAVGFQARARRESGPALEDAGTLYHKIKYATETAPAELEAEAKRWFKPFVDGGHAEILKIQTEVDGDLAAVFIAYRNRRTSKRESARTNL